MSINSTTVDGEFCYILQWFNEWSELQRDDFISALIEYLMGKEGGNTPSNVEVALHVNGLACDMNKTLTVHDRPMSLFQCRIKLFRQWHPKWPLEFKEKLQKKIMEIDNKVGEKLIKFIQESSPTNPQDNAKIDSEEQTLINSMQVLANENNKIDVSVADCTPVSDITYSNNISDESKANKPNDDNRTNIRHNATKSIDHYDCNYGDSITHVAGMEKPVELTVMDEQVFSKESPVIAATHSHEQQQQDNPVAVSVSAVNVTQTTISNTIAEIPLVV